MEMLSKAFKSRTVWSGILKIVTGISLLATGDKTLQQELPEILMALWGIVDIAIRFDTHKSLEDK